MKNQKGFAEVAILYYVIAAIVLFFVPNPVSKSIGVGIQPNKSVQIQTQTVEPIKDAQGNPVAYKTITNISDQSIQQHVTFWQWLTSLPFMAVLLMGLGIACPAVATVYHTIWGKAVAEYNDLTGETKRIVVSVKAGLATITDPIAKQNFMNALSTQQDQSTKDLVKELLKGQ